MLKLQKNQWICDTCGEVINAASEGYVEWINEEVDGETQCRDFHIVHQKVFSPRKNEHGCYQHGEELGRSDLPLENFMGGIGIAQLLSFIDLGEIIDPDNEHDPRINNFREYAEIFRRLHLPFYEEARLYFEMAKKDGFFDGANEIWVYSELEEIVKRYGDKV
ncbi:hypothetical protein KAI54_03425 [Candidatus Gracilibacteria bacterium]|nr:hypothetical protein [Candidatus Gracilibacteria bacterium]